MNLNEIQDLIKLVSKMNVTEVELEKKHTESLKAKQRFENN